MGEIQAKIDNPSAQYVHYNELIHYYGVHYYKSTLKFPSSDKNWKMELLGGVGGFVGAGVVDFVGEVT